MEHMRLRGVRIVNASSLLNSIQAYENYDAKRIINQVEPITAEQIRAARAALGLSVQQIARETSIGSATLKRYEATSGVPKSRKGHLLTLQSFFESAGIEFIGSPEDGPGIRVGKPPTR